MPDFFNVTPLLTAVQAVLMVFATIALIWYIFQDFIVSKQVIKGVSRMIIIGLGMFIIATPQSAINVAQWFATTVGFG